MSSRPAQGRADRNQHFVDLDHAAGRRHRPERFIGMHFMNPVPAMKLVELIRGIATDEATFGRSARSPRCSARPRSRPRISAFIVNRIRCR